MGWVFKIGFARLGKKENVSWVLHIDLWFGFWIFRLPFFFLSTPLGLPQSLPSRGEQGSNAFFSPSTHRLPSYPSRLFKALLSIILDAHSHRRMFGEPLENQTLSGPTSGLERRERDRDTP